MRSRRWMVWSAGAATLLFLIAQFIPVRSFVIDEDGLLSATTNLWIVVTSTIQEQPDTGPFTSTVIDAWRSLLSLLVFGLLVSGLILALRGFRGAPVVIAAGAMSVVALALWVLATPIPSDFGWVSRVSLEAFESQLTLNLNPSIWVGVTFGFYLLSSATLAALVSLAAAVVHAAGNGPVITATPETDAPTGAGDG